MKKVAAYYLVLLYAASLLKAPTIWLADVIAHACFPEHHKSVLHKEGGRYHVHYQISEAAKQEQPQPRSSTPCATDEVAVLAAWEELPMVHYIPPLRPIFIDTQPSEIPLQVFLPPPRLIAC